MIDICLTLMIVIHSVRLPPASHHIVDAHKLLNNYTFCVPIGSKVSRTYSFIQPEKKLFAKCAAEIKHEMCKFLNDSVDRMCA